MPSLRQIGGGGIVGGGGAMESHSHRLTFNSSFYHNEGGSSLLESHHGNNGPTERKAINKVASSSKLHLNDKMPFYLNFVEDNTLDRIPRLKFYKTQKFPSTRKHLRQRFSRKIPTEPEIKDRYKFKIPLTVQNLENEKSSIHALEKPWPGIEKVLDYCRNLKTNMDSNNSKIKEIRKEMDDFAQKQTNTLDTITDYFRQELRHYYGLLRIDSLNHQNNKMSLHKQAQRLKRDEMGLIAGIKETNGRVYELEDEVFGAQVFHLEASDPEVKDVHEDILRPEHAWIPEYGPIVELEKGKRGFELAGGEERGAGSGRHGFGIDDVEEIKIDDEGERGGD